VQSPELAGSAVNYDEAPIAETELDGVSYRVDTGHGSAIAVSKRDVGTWDWTPVTEGRWDGVMLKAKGMEFAVVTALAGALREAMQHQTD
jgi:hypothetical protein